jgi:hypothetical protein
VNGSSSAASNIVTYTPTAVIDPVLDGAVFTYPNPVQKDVFISNGTHRALQYKLFSADGKELLRIISSQSSLNISTQSLSAGIYFIQIRDARSGKMTVKKIVKS